MYVHTPIYHVHKNFLDHFITREYDRAYQDNFYKYRTHVEYHEDLAKWGLIR